METMTIPIPCPPLASDVPVFPIKRHWFHKFKLFGLWFAVSNGRIRKRGDRDASRGTTEDNLRVQLRRELFARQGTRCNLCGQEMDYRLAELHHVLPVSRFPELRFHPDNAIMLCRECHKAIHTNPFLNARMQSEKAQELHINLTYTYDYENATIPRRDYAPVCNP